MLSTLPRLVSHQAPSHVPQVLGAAAGAASLISSHSTWPSTTTGAGSDPRKVPTPIQNALRAILSQSPVKNQPASTLNIPPRAQKSNGPTTPSKSTGETLPESTKSSDVKSVKGKVVEDNGGSKGIEGGMTKGKIYSQLESLLCEEYLSQEGDKRVVSTNQKENKEDISERKENEGRKIETDEGKVKTSPPPEVPAHRLSPAAAVPPPLSPLVISQNISKSPIPSPQVKDDEVDTLNVESAVTRKRPLSNNEVPPPKKLILQVSTTSSQVNSHPPKSAGSAALSQSSTTAATKISSVTVAVVAGSAYPPQSCGPTHITPSRFTAVSSQPVPALLPDPAQPPNAIPLSLPQPPNTIPSPQTPTTTPSTQPPDPVLSHEEAPDISDLILDTSDSAVSSLANQLGLDSVNPSLFNLSDFMSFIQPSEDSVSPAVSMPPPTLTSQLSATSDHNDDVESPLQPYSSDPPLPPPPRGVASESLPPTILSKPAGKKTILPPPPLIMASRPLHLPLEQFSTTPKSQNYPTPGLTVHSAGSPSPIPALTSIPAPLTPSPTQYTPTNTPTVPHITVSTPTVLDITPINSVVTTPVGTISDDLVSPATNYLDLTDIGSLMKTADDSKLLEGIPEDMAKSIQTLAQLDEQTWN